MAMATEGEILAVLSLLSAAYPAFDMTEETVAVYVMTLADLDAEILKASALQHIAESRFFPSVAEIRERALFLAETNNLPSAFEAWGQVVRLVRRYGFYQLTDPEKQKEIEQEIHPVVLRTVEAVGGWRALCLMPEDQVMAMRAHFSRAFDAFAKRLREEKNLLPEVRQVLKEPPKRKLGLQPIQALLECGNDNSA